MSAIRFRPRWREEVEAISPSGKLVFEYTIGRFHAYFPDEARWRAVVPAWAAEAWAEYRDALQRWCAEQRAGFSIVSDAHVYEEPLGEDES